MVITFSRKAIDKFYVIIIPVMEFQALAPTDYYKTTRYIEKYKMTTK